MQEYFTHTDEKDGVHFKNYGDLVTACTVENNKKGLEFPLCWVMKKNFSAESLTEPLWVINQIDESCTKLIGDDIPGDGMVAVSPESIAKGDIRVRGVILTSAPPIDLILELYKRDMVVMPTKWHNATFNISLPGRERVTGNCTIFIRYRIDVKKWPNFFHAEDFHEPLKNRKI